MGDKRVDIKLGYLCNNNCRFCVVADKRYQGNKNTLRIKKELKEAKKRCSEVVFTGGEVTVRQDILELVSYAKELGFKIIQLQTNGRMLSYIKFCKELIKAGANEFSPAIHGHTPELHDYLTRSKGSFNQTVQAIKNLKKLKQKVITNTVVTKPNYRHLPEIAKMLIDLGVDQYQFAFVHANGNARKNFDSIVPVMSLAAPYIKKGLGIGIKANVKCMAEAMPYCMMEGYEKYISENYIPLTEVWELDRKDTDFLKTKKTEGKTKFPQCKKCKYDEICEGPWREYPKKMGDEEFKAVKK
ncbi:radical SAM protein [Candidatus Woesearchaeota archaeon]|nr:radical SAM protein [Candidatus Woesearchaeota archaeon]